MPAKVIFSFSWSCTLSVELRWFLPLDTCVVYAMALRPSVCPSHAGIVSKRLNCSSWVSAQRLPSVFLTLCYLQWNSIISRNKTISFCCAQTPLLRFVVDFNVVWDIADFSAFRHGTSTVANVVNSVRPSQFWHWASTFVYKTWSSVSSATAEAGDDAHGDIAVRWVRWTFSVRSSCQLDMESTVRWSPRCVACLARCEYWRSIH